MAAFSWNPLFVFLFFFECQDVALKSNAVNLKKKQPTIIICCVSCWMLGCAVGLCAYMAHLSVSGILYAYYSGSSGVFPKPINKNSSVRQQL